MKQQARTATATDQQRLDEWAAHLIRIFRRVCDGVRGARQYARAGDLGELECALWELQFDAESLAEEAGRARASVEGMRNNCD